MINKPFKAVGAAWKSKTKKGTEYKSIRLNEDIFETCEKEDILKRMKMFPNFFKKEEKQPDYIISAPVKNENTEVDEKPKDVDEASEASF